MTPSSPYIQEKAINAASPFHSRDALLGWLDIELTERCNNNCIHCCINLPADDLRAQRQELSTREVKNILQEAASLGCLKVRFTGGEPLLREDFAKLYVFARKLGLRVLIFTNATLINARLADLFCSIPPLEKIEISLYGMKRSSYEAVTRISGSFEAAWRGISLLLEKKIPFVVKGALLPPNEDEIDDFEQWAKEIVGMDSLPSYSVFFNLRHRRDVERNELIRKIRPSAKKGLKILTRSKAGYIKEMKEFCSKFMHQPGDRLFSCGSGRTSGCVDAYGKFQPCMLLRCPDCAYDLKKGNLKDALENFFPRMRQARAKDPQYLAQCARCFLKGLCEQCPAKSWLEHGILDRPVSYLCDIAHAQAEFLGLLKVGEKAWQVQDWESRIRDFLKNK